MNKYAMFCLLFAGFILEGSLFPWFFPSSWLSHLSFRFVYVLILLISLQGKRHYTLALGLIFGFLYDVIYYGHMLGLYTFVMGIGCYGAGLYSGRLRPGFLGSIGLISIFLIFLELSVYSIYRLFQIHQESFLWTFVYQITPSILLNLFVAIIFYLPFRVWAEKSQKKTSRKQ